MAPSAAPITNTVMAFDDLDRDDLHIWLLFKMVEIKFYLFAAKPL